jgi:hypothetical protein
VTTAEGIARELLQDPDRRALYELALLEVPDDVAEQVDRLLTVRDRQRAASLRLAAADKSRPMTTVRRLRQERGWTQRETAAAAGVAPRVVWAAENTPQLLSDRSWQRLARALNVTTDALLS